MLVQKNYIKLFLISTAIAILLSAAINFLVDPYGLHRLTDHDQFNRKKPKAGVNGQLAKPYNVQRVQPRTLVLGNSRAEVGIDPESASWPSGFQPVYNMALPATNIDVAFRSLQHTLHVTKLQLVVVGIDFFEFLVDDRQGIELPPQPDTQSEFQNRLLVNPYGARNDRYQLQRIRDFASALFSIKTLADSLQTVALQSRDDHPDLTRLGFNPMNEYHRFVRTDGHHALFQQVTTTYLTNYIRGPKTIYRAGTSSSAELEYLRRIIELCHASGTRLILYIHPNHAHVLESYRIAGLWPLFEEWKRAIVRLAAAHAAAHPAGSSVEIWDFSAHSTITNERVPAAHEKGKTMQWYWEAGHYKREVGDLMLARMLMGGTNGQPGPLEFGIRLNDQNLDSHLTTIRDAQQRYANDHADEIVALETLAQAIKTKLAGKKTAR